MSMVPLYADPRITVSILAVPMVIVHHPCKEGGGGGILGVDRTSAW